ncbi:putative cytochrome [Shigella dysenteriae]|uniref:Putative cytochrome n=1 Tax=Shigella dysenteriae TaxID=622 RepID=A0A2X2IAT0_SHIDY|nr:putative cytochrome [Shigella dysenteriae]
MDWYLKVLKNYVGFRGRARRKEYWMFILVNIIFTFVLGLLDKMLGWQRAGGEGILTTIYGILVFLPWWQFSSAACHDTRPLGVWALLFLIPFIGWLIIIVFNCQAGTPGETALDLIQNWNLKTNLLAGCLTHPAFIIMLMNE